MGRRLLPLACAAAVVVSVVSCDGGSSAEPGATAPSSPTTQSTSPAAPTTSATSDLPAVRDLVGAGATQLDVPGGRDWLILAGGSAWAASDGMDQLDGSTGEVRRSLSLPGPTCLAMDAGYGAVWVGVCGTPMLVRVDARTGRITAKVPLEVGNLLEESSVAAGAGGVWALSAEGELVTLDPTTNKVAVHRAPAGATAVRAGFGALWVTNYDAGSLLRVDPASHKVVARIAVGSGPRFLAVGEGGVWVLNQFDGTVSRVDPRTNKVTATVTVSDVAVEGGDIAAGGGSVWARVSDSLVARIDPGTNKIVARYGPSAGSGSVAADPKAVWVSAHDINAIWRLPGPDDPPSQRRRSRTPGPTAARR